MRDYDERRIVRNTARAYEQALDPARRKRLGQFFTGVPLGKLLAHLALRPNTRTVLDPMVGHGDLLDATCEAAAERGNSIERLDGIEIDKATADTCLDRLAALIPKETSPDYSILTADAFDPATLDALPVPSYDLVIANPPYVRYQTRNGNDAATDPARAGLEQIVDRHHMGADGAIWKVLAQSYSGLADLSVPAWILAGYLVRPGGRLALVVPATWRSRDYADVIRYLLLRCFALETIVADTQPGWFSDALVRTHLIIARRLSAAEARQCLSGRERWPEARWLHVAPDAADGRSLVGAAFVGEHPEADFAAWVHANAADAPRGIEVRTFDLRHEWATLHARLKRQRWYPTLEGGGDDLPLFSASQKPAPPALPETLRDMLPSAADTAKLIPLEDTGIKVGQGLRTGCNRFFYVTASGTAGGGSELVNASLALGGAEFAVPSGALHPVLRRQAEMERRALAAGERADIENLLGCIRALPPDGKLASLKEALAELRLEGYGQAMVFARYADTMDFLRDALREDGDRRLMCFSGRGGGIPSADGAWRGIGRDDARRRFREGEADILLCTDAAAEGLNFQFCGALINYDMPWNPMRVEQRIGRIDRLGQQHPVIRIVNLHYEGTVETDVYRALRSCIGLFETVVGRLQPILARLPRTISDSVLSGGGRDDTKRAKVANDIERQAREASGFDLDAALGDDLAMPERAASALTMEDLDRVIASPDLMPPGADVQPMAHREYGLLAPGMAERLRVTTDPSYYEEHAESVELWSPGNPLFRPPEFLATADELPPGKTLRDILDR